MKESLGLPSSARSPMRFTASLRKDETAKTVRPTGVPEKGPTRRSARPAALPRKLKKCWADGSVEIGFRD